MIRLPVGIKLFFHGVEIVASSYNDLSMCRLNEIFGLRKQVFIDRRKWNIKSYKGGDLECDEYDNDEAYYIYILIGNFVAGCVRLRPSTSPTLMTGSLKWLKDVAELGEDKLESTWEASRFFVHPALNLIGDKGRVDLRTHILFISMIQFGMSKGVVNYEVVVDAMMMRVLRMCGWPLNVLSSGVGSLSEKVYYGVLPCCFEALENIFFVVNKNYDMHSHAIKLSSSEVPLSSLA